MNKTIKMVATEGSTRVEITETFEDIVSWQAIAYQFQKFLAAQGYQVTSEDVGADVESYVGCVSEEEQW